jgi:hypothetical protein
VPAEIQFGKKCKLRNRCKVLHRSRQPTPPRQEEPTSFPEYVAQQPNHVQRLPRECDLSENATLKLVSLIHSTRSFVCGSDGGLLNRLGTFGYLWSDPQLTGELLPFGMGHVPGASLIMSSTRTEMGGIFAALTHLRLIAEFFTSFSARKPHAAFIVTVGLLLPGSMTNTTKTLGPCGGVDSTTISK